MAEELKGRKLTVRYAPLGVLDELQKTMHMWRRHNFPEADAEQQFMGMVEELGELAHSRLKRIQNIRGEENLVEQEIDAIGDLLIYAFGYCSYRSLSLGYCLQYAWEQVRDRDWVKYPNNGVDA